MERAVGRPVTVAVVDDHPVVRTGIRMLLRDEPGFEVVAEAWDLASALEAVQAHHPAVLLLDLNLPDGSGLDALPVIAAASPETKVIALTMQEGHGFAVRALAAGACGYLLKEAAEAELVTALRSAASGGTYLDPRVGAAMAKDEDQATADPPLSERERQVIRLLALGHTNAQVAQQLHFSERTIESYRAQVRQKLGIRDRAGLTEYARANGLLGEPSD
jgi:two-component system, NarL family, response regulator NreC